MTPRIPRLNIPHNTIERIPPPVIRTIDPPTVRGIIRPVVDVPTPIINYPTIDVPTEEDLRIQMDPQEEEKSESEEDTRDLPETPPVVTPSTPTITIGGIEAPLPEPAPLITAGATAVVTATVTLGATMAMTQVKKALDPAIKSMARKRKVKIKNIKPVLHYVLDTDGVDIYQYSHEGTKLIDTTQDIERYLRDQVETNSFYEIDNKIIIDDRIKSKFTKEGAMRFKALFAPAKTIAKKLSSKFAI